MVPLKKSEKTRVDRYVEWFKNNVIFSLIIFLCVIVIAMGSVFEGFTKIHSFWAETFDVKPAIKPAAPPSQPAAPDINVALLDLKQVLPITGPLPYYDSNPVYCEAVKARLMIKHDEVSTQSINVYKIAFEANAAQPSPKVWHDLTYTPDADEIIGHGIVIVKEYIFNIDPRGRIGGNYLLNRHKAIKVDPENIFSSNQLQSFTLNPSGDDAYYQLTFNVELKKTGLYKFRFHVYYGTPDSTKEKASAWSYLLKK